MYKFKSSFKYVTLLLGLLLFNTSCLTTKVIESTSGISSTDLQKIPSNSSVILVKSSKPASVLFDEIATILLQNGHRIQNENQSRLYINTEGKDVGQSTLQRMTINVEEVEGGALGRIASEWKPGTTAGAMGSSIAGVDLTYEWETASWQEDRLGIAFAEGYKIALALSDVELSFE